MYAQRRALVNASYVNGANAASLARSTNRPRPTARPHSAAPARTALSPPTTTAAVHRRGASANPAASSADPIHGSHVAARSSSSVPRCNSGTCSDSTST